MIHTTKEIKVTRIYLVTNCYGDPNKVYIGKFKYSYIVKNIIRYFRFRSYTHDFCDIVLVGMER